MVLFSLLKTVSSSAKQPLRSDVVVAGPRHKRPTVPAHLALGCQGRQHSPSEPFSPFLGGDEDIYLKVTAGFLDAHLSHRLALALGNPETRSGVSEPSRQPTFVDLPGNRLMGRQFGCDALRAVDPFEQELCVLTSGRAKDQRHSRLLLRPPPHLQVIKGPVRHPATGAPH